MTAPTDRPAVMQKALMPKDSERPLMTQVLGADVKAGDRIGSYQPFVVASIGTEPVKQGRLSWRVATSPSGEHMPIYPDVTYAVQIRVTRPAPRR